MPGVQLRATEQHVTNDECIRLMYSDVAPDSESNYIEHFVELLVAGKFVEFNDLLMRMEYNYVRHGRGVICMFAQQQRHFLTEVGVAKWTKR